MLLTFLLVVIGWVFFRAETIIDSFAYLRGIFDSSLLSMPYLINRDYYVITFVGIIIMLLTEWAYRHHSHNFTLSQIKFAWIKWAIYFIMLFLLFINSSPAADFIYFQF